MGCDALNFHESRSVEDVLAGLGSGFVNWAGPSLRRGAKHCDEQKIGNEQLHSRDKRAESPNAPNPAVAGDTPERRGTCMAGGKAAEAGAEPSGATSLPRGSPKGARGGEQQMPAAGSPQGRHGSAEQTAEACSLQCLVRRLGIHHGKG